MPLHRTRPPLAVALAGLLAGTLAAALAGCAGAAGAAPDRRVEVRIAASPHPVDYEVRLAQAEGGYAAVHRMRTGETRSFPVPAGWVVVRIPGLCVVPTGSGPASVVEVGGGTCRLA